MPAPSNGNGNGMGHGNGHGHGRFARAESATLSHPLPPQNLEAEQGVLGSILLDNDVLHDVVGLLDVDHFYRDNHQILYRAIRDLYDLGKAIDAITISDELIRRDQFKAIGGDEFISQILGSVPHAANAKYYAQIVRQKAVSRALIESASHILQDGYSNNFTAEELLEDAERRIFAIAEDQSSS
jgi:replicative DNA helicase